MKPHPTDYAPVHYLGPPSGIDVSQIATLITTASKVVMGKEGQNFIKAKGNGTGATWGTELKSLIGRLLTH